EGLGVGQAGLEPRQQLDVPAHPAVGGGRSPSRVRVVPEVGATHVCLERGEASLEACQVEVGLGLLEALAERGQVVSEVAHRVLLATGRETSASAAVAQLVLL